MLDTKKPTGIPRRAALVGLAAWCPLCAAGARASSSGTASGHGAASLAQIQQFAALFPMNARPVQSRHRRFLLETV
jgi:carbonic anhydrase